MTKTDNSPKHVESGHGKEIDLTVSLLAANVYGVAAGLLPGLLSLILFLSLWNSKRLEYALSVVTFLHFIAVFLVGTFIHEGLHAVGWMLFAGVPRNAIEIGVKWKLLTPYAHSQQAMPAAGYRWGTALPGLLMGILPALLAVVLGSGLLLLVGVFFTVVAGGDFLVLWLLRSVPGDALVEDHPTRVGCIIIR